jgi:SAM-dependent methyltransferase
MRHYMSTYAWDHYGDKAPDNEFIDEQQQVKPGSVVSCLHAGLSLLREKPQAPMLDIGCAAGRSAFELAARYDGLTLGIDLNFSLLRIAQNVLQKGVLAFPLKTIGIIYKRHQYDVALEKKQNVDFWVCDALALPFENETFRFISALNVLDTVTSPVDLLKSINNAVTRSGSTVLATPYDWSPPVPVHNWVGGHTQRGPEGGSSEKLLRNLLTPDQHSQPAGKLKLIGEIGHHPWYVRIHGRRTACYDTHILACTKA